MMTRRYHVSRPGGAIPGFSRFQQAAAAHGASHLVAMSRADCNGAGLTGCRGAGLARHPA
jgi:hypothetical protein